MSKLKTLTLGYPRVGKTRRLKKASEKYWKGDISADELQSEAKAIRQDNWETQSNSKIDLIPSGDFTFYDQVLATAASVGAVPERFGWNGGSIDLETFFLMARGKNHTKEAHAMEMTKWFDTNYHYIVPEFTKDQSFSLACNKVVKDFEEAKAQGIDTIPVLIGPITFLYLGKESEDFSRTELIDRLLPVYEEILKNLASAGAQWVQIHEPALSFDLPERWLAQFAPVYEKLSKISPSPSLSRGESNAKESPFDKGGLGDSQKGLKILLANYFGYVGEPLRDILKLPVDGFHLDFVRGGKDLETVLSEFPTGKILSAGIVNGRNIWKNDYAQSLEILQKLQEKISADNLIVASSCSLQHVPLSLKPEKKLDPEVKNWLAFAEEKLTELTELSELAVLSEEEVDNDSRFIENQKAIESRRNSTRVNNPAVRQRLSEVKDSDFVRNSEFSARQKIQKEKFNLPEFPTTTIGSFPQTNDVRLRRRDFLKGNISQFEYDAFLEEKTTELVRLQEELDIDVLVHGEFERNDMVQYFGELMEGFVFTQHAWVQSYGSRYLKPPIIFGDVVRPEPMTIRWSKFAQSITDRPMKGMLTGPVTILQWSFVREDISRKDVTWQIALALQDEVNDLEKAGIGIIQVDEPALREGLPLRDAEKAEYLDWSTKAFKISTSGVQDETQIHTHMCYCEFNEIIDAILALDADVISVENSRSNAELLEIFNEFEYTNEIGPGVWDIHSPRVPSKEEMFNHLKEIARVIPKERIWVNPDCGLKTRDWLETNASLKNMVAAAKEIRNS